MRARSVCAVRRASFADAASRRRAPDEADWSVSEDESRGHSARHR